MKPRFTLNVGAALALIGALCAIYYLLFVDKICHLSIHSIVHWERLLTNKYGHFFISGILPIYLSLLIFGVTAIAMRLGSKLQQQIILYFNKQPY